MQPHLLEWAAQYLRLLAGRFGESGANDEAFPPGFTTEQCQDFIREHYRTNSETTEAGGPEYADMVADLEALRCPPDFACASTLADLLMEEGERGVKEEANPEPDFLDQLIAEGEARSPGFAAKIEAALTKRVWRRGGV